MKLIPLSLLFVVISTPAFAEESECYPFVASWACTAEGATGSDVFYFNDTKSGCVDNRGVTQKLERSRELSYKGMNMNIRAC